MVEVRITPDEIHEAGVSADAKFDLLRKITKILPHGHLYLFDNGDYVISTTRVPDYDDEEVSGG